MEQEERLHPYLTLRGKPTWKTPPKHRIRKKYGKKPVDPAVTLTTPLFWMHQDPLMSLKTRASSKPGKGRKAGHIQGYRLSSLPAIKSRAKKAARKVVEFMKENKLFIADNDVAEEAVLKTIEVLRGAAQPGDKLRAAKVLLEYTQRKPVAETEVTLNRAEAFLEAVLKEADKTNET